MGSYRELFQKLLERMRFLLLEKEGPERLSQEEEFLEMAEARLDFTVLENLLSLIDEYTGFKFDKRQHRRGMKQETEARPPRYCVTCGKMLTGAKRKYCSRICQYGGIIHIARPACISCGEPLARKAKWCPACRKERLREYNREYARARRARARAESVKKAA